MDKIYSSTENRFFEQPILNSPYVYPKRHWELDKKDHQPTQKIIETRRLAEYITPIPKPRKQKGEPEQKKMLIDEGKGISSQEQQYMVTASVINELRKQVDAWRNLKNPNDWHVTPETTRLLQHWRHFKFNNEQPFFCQVEAAETVIWLTEVAPVSGKTGKSFIDHIIETNKEANPELLRLALKLATGAGKTKVITCVTI